MIPVFQTIFPTEGDASKGNCFAACVASLLEIPLGSVPHVMSEDNNWRILTNEWLALHKWMGTVEIHIETEEAHLYQLPPNLYVIVSGRTTRHPTRLHAVVARTLLTGSTWEYLHDPCPNGNFLTVATHLMWLVPLDPARLT